MRKIIPLFLVFLLFIAPIKAYGVTNNKDIDLTVYSKKLSYEFENLKPGDSITEKFTIYNNGNGELKYLVKSKSNDTLAEDKLFQQLEVEIQDSSGSPLYSGKLHKLMDDYGSRLLKSKTNEELSFRFTVPYELGNEYQGLATSFYIKFFAEGTLGGILPATGQTFSTPMVMVIVAAASVAIVTGGMLLKTYIRRLKQRNSKCS